MKLSTAFSAFLLILLPVTDAFAATVYQIDKVHSYIGFSVKHIVISNVKGNFTDFSGTITYDEEDITKSSVNVTINVASIDTDNERRDNHLKSEDFFDVAEYPEMTFKSTKIEKTDDGLVMHGKLTMRGVTKDISIPFEVLGKATGPDGLAVVAFEGSAKLSRKEYGINWNKALAAGGFIVGDEVKIDIQIEAGEL